MPVIGLPWGAWYRQSVHRLQLPEHWHVDVLRARGEPEHDGLQIRQALDEPVDGPALGALAAGCATACIVVDDLARPTRVSELLPAVLRTIHSAGVAPHATRVVVATGSHGAPSQRELCSKLGAAIVADYAVECHDCIGDLAATGVAYGGRELLINRTFFEAELKLAIGSVLPHSFAAFSGGAKLVLPGLADLHAIARSHKFVQLGLRGGVDRDRNQFRNEIEEIARQLELRFAVCAIPNADGQTAAVFAGDPVVAHRTACQVAADVYATEIDGDYDCVILNAYPKDIDLIQAENAFVALKGLKKPLVRDGGVIVLATAASRGVGCHRLFEPGGVSYRRPTKKRSLGGRELWLYVPSLSTDDVHRLFWEDYPHYREADELQRALSSRLPGPARAAVLPVAPMQIVRDRRTSSARATS